MGDHKRGPTAHQPHQGFLDQRLGLGVERRSRLIEDEHARIADKRPGDGQALFLAAGQSGAFLAGRRVEPGRQTGNEFPRVGVAQRLLPGVRPHRRQPVGDILADAAIKQDRLLGHDGEEASIGAQVVRLHVMAIDENAPGGRTNETDDQVKHR